MNPNQNPNDSNLNQPFMKKLSNFYRKSDYIRPLLIFCFFLFSVFFLYYFVTDPVALATSSYTYYFVLLLFLLGIGIYFYKNPYMIFSITNLVSRRPLITTLFVLTFITTFYVFYTFLNTSNSTTYFYTGKVIDVLTVVIIIFTAFGIVYQYLYAASYAQRGWTGVIGEILLYLPCKIEELAIWLAGQMVNTPRIVYYLLGLEVLILLWVFYYQFTTGLLSIQPQIFSVSENTIYLKNRVPVMSYSSLATITGSSTTNVPMNFGISFWLYLNDNIPTTEMEMPVFCYGGGNQTMTCGGGNSTNPFATQNVHPAITFLTTRSSQAGGQKTSENIWEGAGLKWNKGHLKFYFSQCASTDSSKENSVIMDIPLQKWNLISINYTSEQADVFINGEIVASHTFSEPAIFDLGDSITVGGKDLNGAIKDIQYSLLPFSKTSINMTYNNHLLVSKILPTFVFR